MKKHECVVCHKKNATLELDDDKWICEDCAQYMSDMGTEYDAQNAQGDNS